MSHVIHRATALPPPALHRLGHGFHAFVQLDGSWGLNNAGIHVGERGVTLVDTAFTARRGRALRDAIGGLTGKPVQTIVNTHHHGDHTYGNCVFPAATVVGHDLCRDAVIEGGLETTGWFPGVDWGDIDIVPPTITFSQSLTLYCDGDQAVLRHLGPAHTSNDVIMWVPGQKLLFAGDLLFNGGTPFVVMGSVQGLIDALTEVSKLAPATIVPGHGAVCDADVIDDQLAYLRFVQEVAKSGYGAGQEPLELARRTDLGKFAAWTDTERLVGNLHRAYSELRGDPGGAPLDYDLIVADMVRYNDGEPLRCLA
jgi:cyclase